MIINKIKILNFGPYYKNHEIDFQNDGFGVHLIRGGTGQGKTSIQRAILWGLYGEVKDHKGAKIRPTSLLNRTAQNEGSYKFGVGIDFVHEEVPWKIIRATKATSHQDKKYEEGMTLELYIDGRIVQDPLHRIQRILPSDVSRFYFFDGEMLRDYEELLEEDSNRWGLLKDSIERVLGVPYFKLARNDLEAIKRKFEKERARIMKQSGGHEYEELAESQQKLQDELDDLNRTINSIDEEKKILDNEITESKRKLVDMREVQELAKKRLEIENDIKLADERKNKLIEERKAMIEKVYKNVLAPIAKTLIEKFEIQSKQALDRYNQKQRALEHADKLKRGIRENKCSYCGTILNENKLKELEAELEETENRIKELTQVPEPNLEYENSKNVLSRMMNDVLSPQDIKRIDLKINEEDYEIARLHSELDDVRSKLENVDAEEPNRLEMEIRSKEIESGRLTGIIETKNEEKVKVLEEKNELDRTIASIPLDQMQRLNKRIAFTNGIMRVFEQAISTFREEQKAAVEETATEIFRELRSKEEFDRLKINDQYGLSIVTVHNTILDRSEWRSSGEEQLVALSLIGALNKRAQVKAPIFMDTPFGRLDIRHGERVLKYLPKISDQIVLLVTDREFRKGDEIYLAGSIKTDLTVEHKGEKIGCVIHPTTAGED
jgi:DNA sulfur modification protein DndD